LGKLAEVADGEVVAHLAHPDANPASVTKSSAALDLPLGSA
jgi:hypothetical protein